MTTYKRPPGQEPGHVVSKDTALWAGVAAFFGSLLAVGIFDVFNPDQWVQYVGAILVAAITAGGVYAKERLTVARQGVNGGANAPPPA